MNENVSQPPTLEAKSANPLDPRPCDHPLLYWGRRLLSCNPFYLVSAALLLYGLYRVSVDPAMLGREVSQLCFNLTSLELYEALLVATAIILARRYIWYDSMLLVTLENLFLLVPFILISQAALINAHLVWGLSLLAALLVVLRTAGLRRFVAGLNLPWRLLVPGLAVLIVNSALPIVFRLLHESKVGTRPDWGAAYQTNQYAWWALLPLLCAGLSLIPRALRSSTPPPHYRLMPLGCFTVWLLGTGVHLYCLGYIYDFSLRPDLLAPAIWILLWMLQLRVPELVPVFTERWREVLRIPPLLATFIALGHSGTYVFAALTVMNTMIYLHAWLRNPAHQLPLHLLAISLIALVGAIPPGVAEDLLPGFTTTKALVSAVALYLLIWSFLTVKPPMGLMGAAASAAAICGLFHNSPQVLNWVVQGCLVCLVLHSLRWRDSDWNGARALRLAALALWVGHSIIWGHRYQDQWLQFVLAGLVLVLWLIRSWLLRTWGLKLAAVSALLVLLSGPGNFTVDKASSAPAGLLAIVGSFLLFGFGTAAALTKHRWNKSRNDLNRGLSPGARTAHSLSD